jgi:integrase
MTKTKTKRISLGYGRGAVEQLGSGSWRWQGTIDGERVSITRPSQVEAIAAADAALVVGSKPTGDVTIAEAAEAWRKVAAAGRKGATVQGYAWALDVIVDEMGASKVVGLTRATLRGVLAVWSAHYGAGSIAKLRSVLGRVLDFCVDAEWIVASPMPPRTDGTPKGRRETPHLSPADMATVRRYCVAEHSTKHALALAMLLTGMRPGEARAVQWNAVDLDGARVHVCRSIERTERKGVDHCVDSVKTSRYGDEGDRWLPMPPDLVAVLRRERQAQHDRGVLSPFVFADDRGQYLSTHVVEGIPREIAATTGTRLVSPNGYRHTYLSMLADSNVPSATRKALAGHKSTSTVLDAHYTHDMRRGEHVDTTPYLGDVVEIGGTK